MINQIIYIQKVADLGLNVVQLRFHPLIVVETNLPTFTENPTIYDLNKIAYNIYS